MRQRVMFAYWGRRGLSGIVSGIAEAAGVRGDLDWRLSLSRQNLEIERFAAFGERLALVDTFEGHGGALALWRLPQLERQIAQAASGLRAEWVVNLMPHVWSSALARGARAAGCRYATIIHDADAHPGDATGVLNRLLRADARRADLVLALSDGVAARLSTRAAARRQRVRTLFVPAAKELVAAQPRSAPAAGQAFRVLFAGRIMDYKGLPLLVEAIEALQASGAPVRLSVLGEGPLGPLASRLDRLGAKVANRWVSEEELAQAMADHHVLVLPYLEASQSGPAAQALALGLPVVATPVGALPAQAPHGRAGLIASAVTAEAVGEALGRLIQDRELYDRIAARVWADRGDRSAERFLDALLGSLAERA